MKKVIRFLLVLILCLVCNSLLLAQSIALPYFCDFEDTSEHANWQLNVGNQGVRCANKWHFGKPGSNGGDYGLFVSNDGTSNDYEATGLTVVSYRTFDLLKAGEYEFSFDWRAGGWQDSISDEDGLYVFWLPATENIVSVNNSSLPKWFDESKALRFGRKSPKLSQSDWNTVVDTIKSDGTPHHLVFAWRNGMNGSYPPAACVDNILLMPVGYCHKPYDLKLEVNDLDATFSWSGESESYDVRCYNSRTGKWKEYQSVKDTFVVVEGVEEGMCTYYVRAHCEGISGTWVSISQFIYYPGARCIDFMSLSTENCFTGPNPNNSDGSGLGVGFTPSLVDLGYQSMESRHTIHYDLNEVDPRTDGGLRTVPEGEVASVRLGNWNAGGEAERVVYKYTVDASTSAVLILKYAVVLQDPDHNEIWQPKFELEVLKNGKTISNKGCGEAKFTAGKDMKEGVDGWHKFGTGWWKDWTTISINLSEHDGEEVVVRLTTYDCAELGHFGYAYFTLNCSDGKMKYYQDETGFKVFEGPEGFEYRWYSPKNPDYIISTERVFEVLSYDTSTYYLDVIQSTNHNCYYTLSTPTNYISAYSSDEKKGTVIGGGTYFDGDTAVIIAKANDGYVFDYWYSGGHYYYTDTLKIAVNEDMWFTAYFKEFMILIDGIYYYIDKNNYSAVVARSEDYTGDIVIPEQIIYNRTIYNVIGIEESAFEGTTITSIDVPNGVNAKGSRICCNCQSLKKIKAHADFINYIGEYIMDSKSIEELYYTGGYVEYVHRFSSLEVLDLSATENMELHKGMFVETPDILGGYYGFINLRKLILPKGLTLINERQFENLRMLEEIVIPNGVTEIPNSAFYNCHALAKVKFSENLTSIGNYAFYSCHALENVVIPEGVTEIGNATFYDCIYLENIDLPSTLQVIGDNTFAFCNKVKCMEVKAITPPVIEEKTFYEVSRDIEFIVPGGSRKAYAAHEYWKEFMPTITDIENVIGGIEIYSVDGKLYIEDLTEDYQVYSISGMMIYTGRDASLNLANGVYILRIGDKTQKVVI